MRRLFLLTLLSSPALLHALFVPGMISSANAAEIPAQEDDRLSCSSPHQFVQLTCTRVKLSPEVSQFTPINIITRPSDSQPTSLDSTDEESDAAVIRFGCDCPPCHLTPE
ncbi:hypothetical protein FM036_37410 [Nostoc sp. HG1]|nr:hypothetical protein [Nostoc sp. HG1]